MISKIGLFQSIVFVNLALAHSFRLINYKNINNEELLFKLANILKNEHESSEHATRISVQGNRKDIHEGDNKYERKKLIKTILPHGQEVNIDTENVLYKTLVRIHKNKPIFVRDNDGHKLQFDLIARSKPDSAESVEQVHEDNVKQNQNSTNDVSIIWQKLKALKNKHKEKADKKNLRSFKDFKLNTTKVGEKFSSFWKRLKNALPLKKHEKKNPSKDRTTLHKLLRLLDDSGAEHLRSSKSGEDNDDSLAPGKIPYNIKQHEKTTIKPELWQPSYSFWNYWTYDKTLHQDTCKGGLIKVGDQCIGSPPH